jgi:hypothetical protein
MLQKPIKGRYARKIACFTVLNTKEMASRSGRSHYHMDKKLCPLESNAEFKLWPAGNRSRFCKPLFSYLMDWTTEMLHYVADVNFSMNGYLTGDRDVDVCTKVVKWLRSLGKETSNGGAVSPFQIHADSLHQMSAVCRPVCFVYCVNADGETRQDGTDACWPWR